MRDIFARLFGEPALVLEEKGRSKRLLGVVTSSVPLLVKIDSQDPSIEMGPLQYVRSSPQVGDRVVLLRSGATWIVVGSGIPDELIIASRTITPTGVQFHVIPFTSATGYEDLVSDPATPVLPAGITYPEIPGGGSATTFEAFNRREVLPYSDGDVIVIWRDLTENDPDPGGHDQYIGLKAVARRGGVWEPTFEVLPIGVNELGAGDPVVDDHRLVSPTSTPSGLSEPRAIGSFPFFSEVDSKIHQMSDGTLMLILRKQAPGNPTTGVGVFIYLRNKTTGAWGEAAALVPSPDPIDKVSEFATIQDGDSVFILTSVAGETSGAFFRVDYAADNVVVSGTSNTSLPNADIPYMGISTDHIHVITLATDTSVALAAIRKTTLAIEFTRSYSGLPTAEHILTNNPVDFIGSRMDSLWSLRRLGVGVYEGWTPALSGYAYTNDLAPPGFQFWSGRINKISLAKLSGATARYAYQFGNSVDEQLYDGEFTVI